MTEESPWAGMNLFLSTDLRIVARDARLMSGFSRLGLHPGGGHYALMGRRAGREATVATRAARRALIMH